MIRRILVPIDGSEGGQHALRLAIELALRLEAELMVLQVIEEEGPLPTYSDRPPEGQDRVPYLADRRFALAAPLLEGAAGLEWSRRVETGYPAETICQIAEDEDFDHIVIGSRGLTPIGRFVIGSVSDKVVRHAPCSVTVTR